MKLIQKTTLMFTIIIFLFFNNQTSFASLFDIINSENNVDSVSLTDTKEIEENLLKILAESSEIDGIQTIGIAENLTNEEFVASLIIKSTNLEMSIEDIIRQQMNDAQDLIPDFMQSSRSEVKDVLDSPTGQFLLNAVDAYKNDLGTLSDAARSKLQMDLEAKNALGLTDVPDEIMDKLFQEIYDPNLALENMTEAEKEYMRKTGMKFGFQLQATDLAKDLASVVGSDTRDWAELIKNASDPNVLAAKYGNDYGFTNDVEQNIKAIADGVKTDRDAIYDQILKVSETYQRMITSAEYKAMVKQYGVDQFVLHTIGGDQNIKDLISNSPDYLKLLKMYQDYRNKYGIDYKTDITSSNTINLGSHGESGLEIVDTASQKNFHVISKVVFTITKKTGSIGNLTLLSDSRLQELGKEYSGIGRKYYDATGRYIPRFTEVSRDAKSVTYEINYTDGTTYDELRSMLASIYQKYNPVIGFNVAKDGIYTIDTNVFANTLTEFQDIHPEHNYSWTTGKGEDLEIHNRTCPEIKYWPYKEKIVPRGTRGAHKKISYLSNKTPDRIVENTWVGNVVWEVNAKRGPVEIPLMGQNVSKTMFITN